MRFIENGPIYTPSGNSCGRPVCEGTPARGGYNRGYSRSSYLTITCCNVVLATLFLVAALPLMALIGLVIKVRDQGPILYRGVRMGMNKKPFFMYKFRTLPVGAQKVIGRELFTEKFQMTTPFTRFLRNTRLDELPQLFNIIRGEMDLVGPRPVRPEVYEAWCQGLKDYDLRFLVRPGLIGHAQLFTPHSTPKRLRAHLDNRYVFIKRRLLSDVLIVAYTILLVLRQVFTHLAVFAAKRMRMIRSGVGEERRRLERIPQQRTWLIVPEMESDDSDWVFRVQDINEFSLRVDSNRELPGERFPFILQKDIRRRGKRKRKRAYCQGTVFSRHPHRERQGLEAYVITYTALSPLNQYMVDQYFLAKSIVIPQEG